MLLAIWNIKSLREFVHTNEENEEQSLELIRSIDSSLKILKYHTSMAVYLNEKIRPYSETKDMSKVLSQEDKIAIQANIQAAAHLTRATFDIFAQLINRIVLSGELTIRECDFNKVVKKMSASPLKSHLLEVKASEEYLYLNAWVNTVKHRNLVMPNTQASYITDDAGVYFNSFEFNEKEYPALWAKELVEKILILRKRVIQTGKLLNENVGAKSM